MKELLVGLQVPMAEFIKIVKSYTNDAFRNVTIWSCPDHEGSLASTHKLHDKIFGKN
jgi:hypothetical protein